MYIISVFIVSYLKGDRVVHVDGFRKEEEEEKEEEGAEMGKRD